MELEKCLVCGLATEKSENDSRHLKNPLKEQLRVVFVLRELLELPLESLDKCFQLSCGENPNSWITICRGQCQEIVNDAKNAYQEMDRARRKLMICQKKIQDKIRLSSTTRRLSSANLCKDYRTPILKLIWESVKRKENAGPVLLSEDFAAGDRMANQLLTLKAAIISNQSNHHSQVSYAVPKLEVENPAKFDDSDHDSRSEHDFNSTIPFLVDAKPNIIPANPSKIKCPQCDYLGKTKQKLWAHQAMMHPKDDSTFQCNICQHSFNTSSRLTKHKYNVHKRPATLKKLFACPHCDYTTNRGNTELRRHIAYKHTQTHNFPCNICDKKFKESGDLRRHQVREHNKCSVKKCEKICETLEELRDHQITSHGKEVNVFKCPECERLFKQKCNLNEHIMAYHGKGNEDVYVCDKCDKSYLTKQRLCDHVRSTHGKMTTGGKVQEKKKDGENLILGI